MTGPLVWRVAVVLVLAALAGPWLGSLMLAIKEAGNANGALFTGVFGVVFISGALVVWATDEPVAR